MCVCGCGWLCVRVYEKVKSKRQGGEDERGVDRGG